MFEYRSPFVRRKSHSFVETMNKRPAAFDGDGVDTDARVYRRLVQCGTKTGLADAIVAMTEAGWIDSESFLATHTLKRRFRRAQASHASASTPYGPVCQEMELPSSALPVWSYCHPIALVHYLSTISIPFASLMASCVRGCAPLRIIVYVDELTPGNALRPEKSRTLQSIYWAFADWPQHVLSRSAAWLIFGTLRSTVVDKIPGGMSRLMRMVLRTFFSPSGSSFAKGVSIQLAGGGSMIVTGQFYGFLADEKAHNQIVGSKGASGTKPCLTCKNVFNRISSDALVPGTVYIDCASCAELSFNTNSDVFAAYDYICSRPAAEQPELQQLLGVKVNEHGLLHDRWAREIHCPVDHMLRDWMHILVHNGLANTEIAYLARALKGHGIETTTLATYLMHWTIPKRHGKVDGAWLSKKRFGKKMKSLSSFAGIMLNIVPIVAQFVQDVIPPDHGLALHARCFLILEQIIGLCALGSDDAMPYLDLLRRLLEEHHELFRQLYPTAVKPKYHHALHLADNAEFLGALISCFVTERKHRVTKRAALHTFRHIDNVVIKDLVNRQCEAMLDKSEPIMSSTYLVSPKRVNTRATDIFVSNTAVLPCGRVSKNDIVFLEGPTIGRVIRFWHCGDNYCMSFALFACCGTRWRPLETTSVVCISQVIDTVTWACEGDAIRVIEPFRVRLVSLV